MSTTDVMSDYTGRRDASRGGGCSKTSAYTDQFGWVLMTEAYCQLTLYDVDTEVQHC